MGYNTTTHHPVSEKQLSFIRTLVTERVQALTALPDDRRATLLSQPETSRDASNLITALLRVPADPKQVSPEAQAKIDGLVAVLDRLDGRDRAFANDLVRSFTVRGDLTVNQWPYVEKLTARASAPKAEAGLYILPDKTIVRVGFYEGRLVAKRLTIIIGANGKAKGSFRNDRSLLDRVPTEGRPLTEAEAQAFGKQYDFCCACARTLNDERSLAVGYGPDCAKDHSWFYPTYQQASEMLNRPVSV